MNSQKPQADFHLLLCDESDRHLLGAGVLVLLVVETGIGTIKKISVMLSGTFDISYPVALQWIGLIPRYNQA